MNTAHSDAYPVGGFESIKSLVEREKERRLLELAGSGANYDLNHPGRKEWEALRAELFPR